MTCAGILLAAVAVSYGAGLSGDLHLPHNDVAAAPVVVCYHGGGWTSMSRQDVRGIAEFLTEKGCVVYNVDYRLATPEAPWPACGDDCIAAARFVLDGGLAAHGVRPEKVWLLGGSAGGHLAVWTGLHLPVGQVAGIVSISGIGDPRPDLKVHPGRYEALFGGRVPTDADIASMDPLLCLGERVPPILLTHAREDAVVPEESARNLYLAARGRGTVSFSQYSSADEPNAGGHCIWRKGVSDPRRLIARVENEISHFMGLPGATAYDYVGKDFARMCMGEGWQSALMRGGSAFSKPTWLERHANADEMFVLLEGAATLYLGESAQPTEMAAGKLVNVHRNTWHGISIADGGKVMVVEKSGEVETEKRTFPKTEGIAFDFGNRRIAFGPFEVKCRAGKTARIVPERVADDVVRVRIEAEEGALEDVRPGAASAGLAALWYGNGHYVRRPGALSLISNGHANATSYDGFDFDNGVSVVMAADETIVELYHDPAARRCGIAACDPCTFTFVAGTNGAAACAIRYRKLFPPRAAPGVKAKAGKFCIDLWNGTLREQARLLRTLKDDFGLGDDVFAYTHNWQRFGYDVGLPDVFPPNPKFGTAADLRDFLVTARACGWYAGVHLNTIDAYESAPSFDESVLCRDADGNRVKAWYNAFAKIQSYRVRPDKQPDSVRMQLESMNGGGCACDTVFVDVIGSLPEAASMPWYDADGVCHPCASVRRGYGAVFDAIREMQGRATGRPAFTSSEAAHDYLTGHLDGGDCQWLELGHEPGEYVWYPIAEYERAVKVPWFDLVNHKAFSLHGAGYSIRYESGRGALFHGIDSDDYLCAEVLSGHPLMTDAYTRDVKNVSAGILVPIDFGKVTRQIVRHYRLAQKTVNELAQAEIELLAFADGDPGRQTVRWSNGTTVWANRGIADWRPLPGIVLPQYGWFATNAVTGTMSAIRRRDGRVIEESFHYGADGKPVCYYDARDRNRSDIEPLTPVATARLEGNRLAVDVTFERFRGKPPRTLEVTASLWLVRRKGTENRRDLPDYRLGDFRGRLGDGIRAELALPEGVNGAYDLLVSVVPSDCDVTSADDRLKFLGTDSFYSRYHLGRVTVGRGFEPFVQPDRHLFERAFPD